MKRAAVLLSIYILLLGFKSQSQPITGTWEGVMGDQFLQLNIQQDGDLLCGYTYDYVLNDKRNFCRTYFKGRYDKDKDEFILLGTSFIINSGSHILMRVRLWREESDSKLILRGTEGSGGAGFFGFQSGTQIWLKRISRKPTAVSGRIPICEPDPIRKVETPVVKTPPPPVLGPPRPTPVKPIPVPLPPPIVKKDSIKIIPPPLVVKKNAEPEVLQKMAARKNNSISRLQVNTRQITLSVYDNGTIDGDTVSIFYNGRLLVNKQRISANALVINLELDEKAVLHEITLFAENLGSIPPNTALIVVTAGQKRYELFSSANLKENAVLAFEYRPKE